MLDFFFLFEYDIIDGHKSEVNMKWYKIEINTETEAVDVLVYLLEEAGIEGAIVEDPHDPMFDASYKGDWDYSEETARQFDHDDVVIKIFIEGNDDITKTVKMIEGFLDTIQGNGLNIGSGKIKYDMVDDDAWKDKWKEYFKPFKIGSKIVIKPSWEAYEKEADELVIEMDPGSAFGSGTHETTSMCIELLQEVITPELLVYDIGCGTGILGIAAAKFGARKVLGVDIAESAIIATQENIDKNGLQEVMSVQLGSLTEEFNGRADVIVANIIADIIVEMNDTIEEFIQTGGYYITSGIVEGKQSMVIESLNAHGFELVKHLNKGDWHAILAQKK